MITRSKKLTITLGVALAVALVASPLFGSYQAVQAAPGKHINGDGAGRIFCPSPPGSSIPGIIDFTADKQKGKITGSWDIVNFTGLREKSGVITGGSIFTDHYSLRGTEDADTLCFDITAPTTITISGDCGADVIIHFEAANGQRADLPGSVVCTK